MLVYSNNNRYLYIYDILVMKCHGNKHISWHLYQFVKVNNGMWYLALGHSDAVSRFVKNSDVVNPNSLMVI